MDPMRERESARRLEDVELVRQVAAGQEPALAELYDRHAPTLHAFALRILGDPAEAEEVLQETFVHAWHQAARYDPARAGVSTWLVLLVRSRAVDRLRNRRVGERVATAVGRLAAVEESAAGLERVQEGERRRRVQAELVRLPAEQRRILELAYYGGMTQTEIADAEGLPLGTVKTRTLLALRKLRRALDGELRQLL
jgi:RNA polymerase sigma-70 factor (ECF subfamily)